MTSISNNTNKEANSIKAQIDNIFDSLTVKQKEITKFLYQGFSQADCCEKFEMEQHTLTTFMTRIYKKFEKIINFKPRNKAQTFIAFLKKHNVSQNKPPLPQNAADITPVNINTKPHQADLRAEIVQVLNNLEHTLLLQLELSYTNLGKLVYKNADTCCVKNLIKNTLLKIETLNEFKDEFKCRGLLDEI